MQNRSSSKLFESTKSNRAPRSAFDLSYSKLFTADMGQLIPVLCDEMVPGDRFEISNEMVIRMNPLVAPVLHEINAFVHYFFVPNRLTFPDWVKYITGDVNGDDATVLPTWVPTDNTVGSLWDYMGFPAGVDPDGAYPVDFPKRAYNLCYNDYYRDQTLVTAIDIETSEDVKVRAWQKDYFTSALPWQQRGTSPALPVTGTGHAVFPASIVNQPKPGTGHDIVYAQSSGVNNAFGVDNADAKTNILGALNNNTVDFSTASTVDINDLRLAEQIQVWLERNLRAGVRYNEFLQGHFDIAPKDETIQRPVYIGGSKSPIIVSEVLQTSETATSPQGNMAGHGISVSSQFGGTYTAKEYGVVIGILSIMPKPAYQQGINRQWLKRSRYEYYFPEFANLSEQAIETAEIYATDVSAENRTVFGYQGRYDEMRYKPNQTCALMRTDFAHWHLGRIFSSAPTLNQTFLDCIPDKRIFAVPTEPGFIVMFGNLIKAIRPLPIANNPGEAI